jgi:ubiquinone biosynthesis protein UbiJ
MEQILNGHVQESTAALDLLSSMQGKSLAIDVEGPGITIVLAADEDRLRVEFASKAPATATVRGTPLGLLAALRGDALSGFKESGIAVTGDAEVAEEFSTLLRLARPDLEEQLSHVLGDVLAHQAGNAARNVRAWTKQAVAALGMNTTEYIQEEGRQLPTRVEVEGFFAEIERLRDDAERVTVRIDGQIAAAEKG